MRLDAFFDMLPERAFQKIGGRMTLEGGGKSSKSPPPPDYSQMAAASKYAAEVGERLGTRQMDIAEAQYAENMDVSRPIIEAQAGLMQQTKEQGDDYYQYMQDTFRPLEKDMVTRAGHEGSDARLEEMAAQAAGDARRGQTQQANMMARQGLRYGYSPGRMGAMAANMAGANASAVAGAMTGARNRQRDIGWARQMDAAGLGRGLAGASLGAYGLANQSGNSAMANQMAPGAARLGGLAQGAGMVQTGAGQQITGLNGILNAQTSVYNAGQQNRNQGGLDVGGLMQGSAAMYTAFSDRRLKKDIVFVGKADSGVNLYEFAYKDSDGTRYRGVMADEIEAVLPAAVTHDDMGYAMVNYDMLGIEMVEV